MTLWLQAGIIRVLAVTSTTTPITNNNNSSQPPWFKRESEALAGIRWWWNVHPSMNQCDWDGIKCNEAGSVTYISCPQYPYFDGETCMDELYLPSFQNLESLYLYSCGLRGTIPYEIGTIPSSIYALTDLSKLEFYRNRLTGSILLEIRNLRNLISLRLGWNNLSGTIPPTMGLEHI
ncbi:hypothetical protein LguiB_012793 [Lonicera macranthoides]